MLGIVAGGRWGDLLPIRPCSLPPLLCNLRCARVGALCQEPPPRSRVCHACPASRPVLCERCSTHADCALNAPPPPPSLPGRVHWVVYPAAPQAREMSCDRPARRCITSVDDRRCERGHPHIALGLGLRAGARVASLPTWAVTGGLSQLRTRTRRLERSCFTSLRSAHGPRSWLGGLIQPQAACHRPSQPLRGLNAAVNVALYGRPVAAQNTPPPSRAVVLHLTAERSWTEALPLRPDSAASRTLSPFPAPGRPKCGTKCGPVWGGVRAVRGVCGRA